MIQRSIESFCPLFALGILLVEFIFTILTASLTHRCMQISHVIFQGQDNIWALHIYPSANFSACCWVVEIFNGSSYTFFNGTSQVEMSTLMSSLTSKENSLHSGVEHCILSFKAGAQTDSTIFIGTNFDEKVGVECSRLREKQGDLTLSKPAGTPNLFIPYKNNDGACLITWPCLAVEMKTVGSGGLVWGKLEGEGSFEVD